MKKRYHILAPIAVLWVVISCERNLEPYNSPECHLNFLYYGWNREILKSEEVVPAYGEDYDLTDYSLAYSGNGPRDTLWFLIETMGFLSEESRPFALQQFTAGDTLEDAVPGVHYVAFDDPEYTSLHFVPAGQDTISIPVILLNDPSLARKKVVLKFGFKDNGVFRPGYPMLTSRRIYFTAQLIQPANWQRTFGDWGPVKHQLMIDWTGKKWDDEYFDSFRADYPYMDYMLQWLINKLDEENAKRLADPEIGDVYREENGKEVKFGL